MCRKQRVLGCCMAAAGAGALLALLLGGGVLSVVLALGLLVLGVCLAGKN